MKSKEVKKGNRRIWLGVGLLAAFVTYIGFGIWGVPAIVRAMLPEKATDALGREVTLKSVTFNPLTLQMRLFGLAVAGRPGEADLLIVGDCGGNVQISSLLPNRIELKRLWMRDVVANVAIEADGSLSVQDILDRLAATEPEVEPDSAEPLVLPKARLQELSVSNIRINFTDRSVATPYAETFTLESLTGRDLGTIARSSLRALALDGEGGPRYHWDFELKASLGSGAKIAAHGGSVSIEPWAFAIQYSVDGFNLASLQPYVDGVVAITLAGAVSEHFAVDARLEGAVPAVIARGEVSFLEVAISDAARRYIELPSLRVTGMEMDTLRKSIQIGGVEVERPQLWVERDASGAIVLPLIIERAKPPNAGPEDPSEPLDITFSLLGLKLNEGTVEFLDRSLPEPATTKVEHIAVEIVDTEYSQSGDAMTTRSKGRVNFKVLGGSLVLDFDLPSLEAGLATSVEWTNLQLAALQPYVSQQANAEVRGGSVSGSAVATLVDADHYTLNADVALDGLDVAEPGIEKSVVLLKRLEVKQAQATPDSLSIASVFVEKPQLFLAMDDRGPNVVRLLRLAKTTADGVAQAEAKIVESAPDLPPIELARFEVANGRIDMMDTTLVSPQHSTIEDMSLIVSALSTAPESESTFIFSSLVEGSGRFEAKGSFTSADPKVKSRLEMTFKGFDLSETSPYWETYVGRSLAMGQFEIVSSFSVDAGQLEGSNRILIDQLTLGDKVQSDRAIGLPVGFAIKLLQDPNKLIEIDDLPVSGDLNDPKVGLNPFKLILRALGNLVIKAATSPLKFLAGMAGGREDLDTVPFATASIDLDADGKDKAASLAQILQKRPGLRLELQSVIDESAERAALQDRLLAYALRSQGVMPTSGLQLLGDFEREAFEANVVSAYQTLAKPMPTPASETVAEPVAPPAKQASPKPKKGLVPSFRRLIGLDSKATENAELPAAVPAPKPLEGELVVAPDAPPPSFAEMKAVVLQSRPTLVVSETWLTEIARERVGALRTEILGLGEIDSSRILSLEAASAKPGTGSSIKIALVE